MAPMGLTMVRFITILKSEGGKGSVIRDEWSELAYNPNAPEAATGELL